MIILGGLEASFIANFTKAQFGCQSDRKAPGQLQSRVNIRLLEPAQAEFDEAIAGMQSRQRELSGSQDELQEPLGVAELRLAPQRHHRSL